MLFVLLTQLAACTFSRPFTGPGYDSTRGVTLDSAGEEVVMVLTHARLGDGRDTFDDNVSSILDTLEQQPGLIGYSVRIEILGDDAWTMTVWDEEANVDRFVRSSRHQTAIHESLSELTDMRFLRKRMPRSEVPVDWEQALQMLQGQGGGY